MDRRGGSEALRFLIVDDSGTGRVVLGAGLARFGTCVGVSDGREALRAFHASVTEEQPFDMIFLDIVMPHMDGITVLKTIRHIEDERGWQNVHVVMTTAHSDPARVREALSAGAAGYLVKPIRSASLAQQLRGLGLIPG